jgi:hypothetical protein
MPTVATCSIAGRFLESPDLQSGEFALESGDQVLKSGFRSQVLQIGIDPEEWPTGITGIDTLFQPRHGLFGFPKCRVSTGYMMIDVVNMQAEGWEFECLPYTLERRVGIVATSIQHAFQADEQRVFAVLVSA